MSWLLSIAFLKWLILLFAIESLTMLIWPSYSLKTFNSTTSPIASHLIVTSNSSILFGENFRSNYKSSFILVQLIINNPMVGQRLLIAFWEMWFNVLWWVITSNGKMFWDRLNLLLTPWWISPPNAAPLVSSTQNYPNISSWYPNLMKSLQNSWSLILKKMLPNIRDKLANNTQSYK